VEPPVEFLRAIDNDFGTGLVIGRAFATQPEFLKGARRKAHICGRLRRAQDALKSLHFTTSLKEKLTSEVQFIGNGTWCH
jgi:hypothetical protein